MHGTIPFLILGAAALTFSSFAQAQFKNHADICITGTGKFELDISFCSLALQSGKHEALSQATLFTHRGRARLELGDREGAIADFNTALNLNPVSAMAYNERDRTYHKAGNNGKAIKEYSTALDLFPSYSAALRNRGTAHLFQGNLEDAQTDFDAAIATVNYDPASRILRGISHYFRGDYEAAIPDLSAAMSFSYPYPEAVLWIYLAERKAGRKGRAALISNAEEMADDAWPRPLIDVYFEKKAPEAELKAALHERKAIQTCQLAQANFYLGALAQQKGDNPAAREHYKKVLEFGLVDAIEYAGAALELQRMGR
jgi:lipoprotein NlpI